MDTATELGIVGVIHVVLVVWALWDLLTSHRSGCAVLFWIVLIILAPWVGPILYLLFGRSRA